jgi:hypothetical protein
LAIWPSTRGVLEVGLLFGYDSSLYWANLHADTAVNAGREINPIPVGTLDIFTGAFVNTGNWASIHTVCHAFTNISHDSVSHNPSSILGLYLAIKV